ncbi:hypothetical protein MNEG_1314 [Monoraphidium neglectum]|jgi:hypothetical protein|uniref:Uncharacterized protein n=1 Tax=Monoraphidium neglectum TaxID=145388 RepID=A0A0D2MVV4_9CHLO|nr:hypothetical protein MNEG_1314 [Monoraphidium neglectum]KIZ06630.1 hypothetical protein MNEG_1314 [Monoraphidium neglectum]|eukprot:XP_013905649.1 hypothetical protein MNEG_1314 [Monoraphidium neglectum]
MVSAMVNASNTPNAARVLNQQLAGLVAGAAPGGAGGPAGAAGGGGGGDTVSMVTGLAMNCTDVPAAYFATAAEISRKLYCGYYQARCDGTTGAQQLAAAYDWKSSGSARCARRERCMRA